MRLQSSISASVAVQVKPHPQQHVFHEHNESAVTAPTSATVQCTAPPCPSSNLHTLAFHSAEELAGSVCSSLLALGTVSVRVTDQAECLDIFLRG